MPPQVPPSLQQLIALRERRARPGPDLGIARTVAQTAGDAGKMQRKLGRLAALWTELVPESLASRTRLAGLHRGVLQVAVDSAATSFELDRLLRGGVLLQLQRRHTGTLVRVKVVVAAIESDTGAGSRTDTGQAASRRKPRGGRDGGAPGRGREPRGQPRR